VDIRVSRIWCLVFFICCILLVASCGGADSEPNGADPGVLEVSIAYVKRPIPVDNQGLTVQTDLREPRTFSSGGDVYIRSNSTTLAAELNITASITGGIGDVKGLNASFDGKRLIFSLRLFDPDPNDDVIPSWNIFEYDLELDQLRRIISDDFTAELGDDLFPAYLPDGRIVFSSSRQRQSVEMLGNEGKTRFSALDEDENSIAMVLHVMNEDGSSINQISFNQSHDLHPVVLANNFSGQLMFSRWDNAGSNTEVNIYKVNPDGSDLEVLYGSHSHATGTNGGNIEFTRLREMSNGNIMAIVRPFNGTYDGGDIVIIDTNNFSDNARPVWSMNGFPGTAQSSATVNNVTTDGSISRNGRYSAAFPLWDGTDRVLVSKSACQLTINVTLNTTETRPCIEPWLSDPTALELSPAYTIWLYDMTADTEKVILRAETGMVITDIVALELRKLPTVIFDKASPEINIVWRGNTLGVVNIKSVYDFGDATFDRCFLTIFCAPAIGINAVGINSISDLGDPANLLASGRPARFVRFVKAVAQPDDNDPNLTNPPDLLASAFGPQRNLGMREILGYAAIEPDGSIKVKVPANVPLAIEVLDEWGRRLGPRHENWFQVRPGDTTTCTGCHTHTTLNNAEPMMHNRSDAEAPSINAGAVIAGIIPNTQMPGTPDPYFGSIGQTMAEVRFDRVNVTNPVTPELQLNADVIYNDVWTDPAIRVPPGLDAPISLLYANLPISIPSPENGFCRGTTDVDNYRCRITINYEQHIHPIWQFNRGANTCIACHTSAGQAPDGQLDLTNGDSDQGMMDQFKSYRELLFADAGEMFDGMNVVNIQITVPVLDGNGIPVLDINGIPMTQLIDDPAAAVTPSMSADGARRSYFIEKMTETELDAFRQLSTAMSDPSYLDHTDFLSDDELRLISEWLDIGAQNFNDPFDPAAPQN